MGPHFVNLLNLVKSMVMRSEIGVFRTAKSTQMGPRFANLLNVAKFMVTRSAKRLGQGSWLADFSIPG